MNEPTPETNPSNTRTIIAALRAVLETHKELTAQEKAEAQKLKRELDRLIGSVGFTSPEGIRVGPAGPDYLSPKDLGH